MKSLTDSEKMLYMHIVFGCNKFNGIRYYNAEFPQITRERFLDLKKRWDAEFKEKDDKK